MSGYFARLAAQVAPPVAKAGAATAGPSASLEQHGEVTTPMAATAPAQTVIEARQPLDLPSTTVPQPPALSTVAPMAMTQPASPRGEATASVLSLPVVEPLPVHARADRPTSASPLSRKSSLADKALPPGITPRQAQELILPKPSPTLVKEAPSVLASPTKPDWAGQEAPPQAPKHGLARPAPEDNTASVGPSFNVRPVQSDHQRESTSMIKPPNPAEAMPRTQVSIGTITLEVRAANPAPLATPAPQAVAEPASAPARFALRRHHVRWS